MGDLSGSQAQAQSLVTMFDELLIKQEEVRKEVHQKGPEYFLEVLEISAMAKSRDTEKLREARAQINSLERETERLQSQEVKSEELSKAQQQRILQLEQEALANQQRTTEQLAEARQQNLQLEDNVKSLQEESKAKSKVIEDLHDELLLRRKLQEDLENHNQVILSGTTSIMEFSKDISTLMEDCFQSGKKATRMYVASTPAPRPLPKENLKRRSMSLDLVLMRTPIIPGLCKICSSRPLIRTGEDGLDSPILPWCPHGSDQRVDLSTAAPTMSSAQLLLPPRGAMKAVASKHLKKIL